VQPDLITMAKSLAGGMPLSAVSGRADVMDAPLPGGLGGTYAGSPPAIAAALAVLEVIRDENLCERALLLGGQLTEALQGAGCSALAEVRGRGSMIAAEFTNSEGQPSADIAKAIQQEALDEGLLLLTCGVHGNVIRFLYPLTIPDAQFRTALNLLNRILGKY
jgi:4-aminobutyrate aminotransferase